MIKNIEAVIDGLDPESGAEICQILEAAKQKILLLAEAGDYDKEKLGIPVTKCSDESVIETYASASGVHPFVETFTLGEFLAFVEANDELVRKRTKRKVGRPKKTSSDRVADMRRQREILCKCLPGLRYNILTGRMQYLKADDDGAFFYYTMEGDDLSLAYTRLMVHQGVELNEATVEKQIKEIAQSNPYNPIVDVMDTAAEKFPNLTVKEANELLESLGTYFFGTVPEEPTFEGMPMRDSLIARYILGLAHLSRNFGQPPAWMPILIGSQGCGKSAFVRYLLPYETGLTGELSGTVSTLIKEPYRLFSSFLWEFPEIDLHMRKTNIEELKMLVTQQKDEFRRPYQSLPATKPRQFAFIGTSNREEIFIDPTGERRYVPISIPNGHNVPWRDLVNISENSEYEATPFCWKIWAAANLLVTQKVYKPDRYRALTSQETEVLSRWQRTFAQVDPWEASVIQEVVSMGRKRFATEDLLCKIGVDVSRQTNADRMRIKTILMKVWGPEKCKKKTINLPGGVRRNGWEIDQDFSLNESLQARVQRLESTKSGGSNDF